MNGPLGRQHPRPPSIQEYLQMIRRRAAACSTFAELEELARELGVYHSTVFWRAACERALEAALTNEIACKPGEEGGTGGVPSPD